MTIVELVVIAALALLAGVVIGIRISREEDKDFRIYANAKITALNDEREKLLHKARTMCFEIKQILGED